MLYFSIFAIFCLLGISSIKAQEVLIEPNGFYLPPKFEGVNGSVTMIPIETPSDYSFLNLPVPTTTPTTAIFVDRGAFKPVNENHTKKCNPPGDDFINRMDWNPVSMENDLYTVLTFKKPSKNLRKKRVARRKACINGVIPGATKECNFLRWNTESDNTVLRNYDYDGCEFKNSTFKCSFISEKKMILECDFDNKSVKMFGLKTDGDSWLLTYQTDCEQDPNDTSGKLNLLVRNVKIDLLQEIKTYLADYIKQIGFEFPNNVNENIRNCEGFIK